jgi:four helix bundle protein
MPSNIAEGDGRFSPKDNSRFIKIAKGSLYELETQLILARKLGFIGVTLDDDISHIRAMLINLSKNLESRAVSREP